MATEEGMLMVIRMVLMLRKEREDIVMRWQVLTSEAGGL